MSSPRPSRAGSPTTSSSAGRPTEVGCSNSTDRGPSPRCVRTGHDMSGGARPPGRPASEDRRREPVASTVNKIVAGAAAAATAALAGSLFGAVGTIIGAAIGSVISTTAAALYQRSLERTREAVRSRARSSTRHAADVTRVLPQVRPPPPGDRPADARRRRVLRLLGATAVVFLIGLLGVTAVEWSSDRQVGGRPGTSVGSLVNRPARGIPASTEPSRTTSPPTPSPTGAGAPSQDTHRDTGTSTPSPGPTASGSGTPAPTPAQATPTPTGSASTR